MLGGPADAMIDYDANAAPLPAQLRRGGLVTLAHATHAAFDDMAGGALRLLGNLDGLGCRSLLANLHLDTEKDLFAGLGSPEIGIAIPAEGTFMPCQKSYADVMRPGLQHQLTTLAVRAFFDSQFAGAADDRSAAADFLARGLPGERPEVSYRAAGLRLGGEPAAPPPREPDRSA